MGYAKAVTVWKPKTTKCPRFGVETALEQVGLVEDEVRSYVEGCETTSKIVETSKTKVEGEWASANNVRSEKIDVGEG